MTIKRKILVGVLTLSALVCLSFAYMFFINPPNSPREVSVIGEKGWTLWLDTKADWKNDELYLPPVDITKITVAHPTCGWENLYSNVMNADEVKDALKKNVPIKVKVPGTVEEYYWDALSDNGGLGNSGDFRGVSWWSTTFDVSSGNKGKRLKLYFTEGIRQRAEIFINEKLIGYELVHQTPFQIDVTDMVKYGEENKISVRITDPNGNFSWGDFEGEKWGKYYFPLSHGFGGILGEVQLVTVSPQYVADIFVKNKPSLKDIDVDIEIANESNLKQKLIVDVVIEEAWRDGKQVNNPEIIFSQKFGDVNLDASQTTKVTFSTHIPNARLWEIKKANLYNLVTTITNSKGEVLDIRKERFGFRFLSVTDHLGKNPRFYFNGKRTTLISAISWGFWPVNGMYPTEELGRRHIQSALDLGMNMLNFHRCQGNSLLLSLADEMGILYYEEPGGFSSYRTKPSTNLEGIFNLTLAAELNHQRFLRMVKRDRNHPSLVYYNMVNEPGWDPDEATQATLMKAYQIDPTRFKSYGSGFMDPGVENPSKIHMLPYDDVLHTKGYCDVHNAGNSPGVYIDENYNSPNDFARNTKGINEIFIWGEEGAVASPPNLEMIVEEKENKKERNGWDGADYKDWYQAYKDYIQKKNLGTYFPSITNLIKSMGNVMYYDHGRFLENVRIADDADLYVYNGYEDMKNDNFSGAVDVYRNLKGDPTIMSQYAQPLYVAVKLRNKIGHVDDTNLFDLFVINEHAIPSGKYIVRSQVETPDGKKIELGKHTVSITGGDTFSDFVAEKIPVQLTAGNGYYKIKAELLDNSGKKIAEGHDELFAVNWRNEQLPGQGAVLASTPDLLGFIHQLKGNAVEYKPELGKLNYICLGKVSQGFSTIPAVNFRGEDGHSTGINLDYFRGTDFTKKVDSRLSKVAINFNQSDKLIPGYDILGNTEFSLRWKGYIVSEFTGETAFKVTYDDGIRVWIDDKLVINDWNVGGNRSKEFSKELEAGKLYKIKIESYQDSGGWNFALDWKLPLDLEKCDIHNILSRVQNDGTKLLLLEDAEEWMEILKKLKVVPTYEVFHPAKAWVGSSFLVREHPFFKDLPVNGAMNWEYQQLIVYDGPKHFGLYAMEGEEAVVSVVGSPFHQIATSVGILPHGKGKIVFSSLDLLTSLKKESKAANVPKKILYNYLNWAAK